MMMLTSAKDRPGETACQVLVSSCHTHWSCLLGLTVDQHGTVLDHAIWSDPFVDFGDLKFVLEIILVSTPSPQVDIFLWATYDIGFASNRPLRLPV